MWYAIFILLSVLNAQYKITKSAFSSGGGVANSGKYVLKSATGQPVTGEAKSGSYIEQGGFYTYSKLKIVGVQEIDASIPKVFSLGAPYPNPVNSGSRIMIKYGLPRKSDVNIRVYDVSGRMVKTLIDGENKAGFYNILWNGENENGRRISQGVYFIRMRASEFKNTKKLVIFR